MNYVLKILTMNFIIALILSLIICQSCIDDNVIQQRLQNEYDDYNYIIIMDSCEYIQFGAGNNRWGSHKGNCKFCKQRK